MASSNPVIVTEDVLKNELQCPVCMEEKRLLLLPCAHRCCPECIKGIAGEERQLDCPTCRAPALVPEQGFPVCVITERINDILLEAREGRDTPGACEKKEAANKVDTSNCEICMEEKVNVRCDKCRQFLCYRCAIGNEECTKENNQHSTKLIEQIFDSSLHQLNQWQEQTRIEVGGANEKLTTLCDGQAALENEKEELERRLETVTQRITKVKQSISEEQMTVDEKSSLLKVTEIIESEEDLVEIIRLTEQICVSQERLPLPAFKSPAGLQFVSEQSTGTQCATVDHSSTTNDILLGCADSVKVYNRGTSRIIDTAKYVSAKIVEFKGEIFISHHDDNQSAIHVVGINIEAKTSVPLYSFPMKTNKASFLSVSDFYIASLDRDTHTIKLYDRKLREAESTAAPTNAFRKFFSKKQLLSRLQTITLPEFENLFNLCFLPDGDLLVTGNGNEKYMLNKYRLGGDPRLIWTCDQLPDACGIAVSANGLIFASKIRGKTIYVVSPEGKKIGQYTSASLPDHYEDISVSGDELAVAGLDGERKNFFCSRLCGENLIEHKSFKMDAMKRTYI